MFFLKHGVDKSLRRRTVDGYVSGLEKKLEKKFLFLKVYFMFLMYEDRTQNYDREIHGEYLIHDTPFPLPHHL